MKAKTFSLSENTIDAIRAEAKRLGMKQVDLIGDIFKERYEPGELNIMRLKLKDLAKKEK